jgi:acetyl-CoA synthetase
MTSDGTGAIEALFQEDRRFPPPTTFLAKVVADETAYTDGKDLESYWGEQAKAIRWQTAPTQVLDWSDAPFAKWFADGRLNLTESCLDRHVETQPDKVAFHWEGDDGSRRDLTYQDLYEETCRLANALDELGVTSDDKVAIYMGMVPELAVAMLACARVGAIHTVVFGGFSAQSLAERIEDLGATTLITADGSWRAGQAVPLKDFADEALASCPQVTNAIVLRRTGKPVTMVAGRDHWYHDLVNRQAAVRPATPVDAEHTLFVLYTSGTTAKPKGIVHSTGGYAAGTTSTHRMVFDVDADDVYWCTADIGWVTGHSYVVYGPLSNGVTSVLFEGVPQHPTPARFWQVIERYRVTVFYTAPTAIRTFVKWGNEHPDSCDLSSLRVLGTVGEPINPDAWMWYRDVIGKGRCPIVDTWWQTETGQIMVSPLPGITATKPGSATFPLPGVSLDVVDDLGASVPLGSGGYLVIDQPWPAMLRGIWGDPDRYVETYWSRFSKAEEGRWVYFAGDGAKRDSEGYLWLLGRVDDVMNISGHRISTLEVESALVDHPSVAEAAVVGRADATTGQAIAAFVTLKDGIVGDAQTVIDLRDHVASVIGKIARPASIVLTPELPKTRSGKIMRRLLRDVSEERQLGDVTTLASAGVIADIQALAAAQLSSDD